MGEGNAEMKNQTATTNLELSLNALLSSTSELFQDMTTFERFNVLIVVYMD